MSDIDAGFAEVLASCTGAEGEVDYADDGWKPPDGDYSVLLEKFTTNTKEKNGVNNGTGKAIFRIYDNADYEGRSFGEFFWLPANPKAVTPGMGNLLRLATCITGREIPVAEIGEAAEEIADAAGSAVLKVRVFSNTSKTDGKTYINTRFLSRVVETEEVTT